MNRHNFFTMSDVTIRQYIPSDLDRCRALWTELTQHHRNIYDDPTIGGDTPGLYFDEHLARVGPEHVWVAEHDGQVVGCVGLIVDDQEAEMEPVVVAAAHRGRGIGRALVNRVIEAAKKLEVRYLSVKPVARNLEAISFFYDSGFRTLGHVQLFMELQPSTRGTWKSEFELFGRTFKY
jgi:N-acetylglutamate synthase-like GNAT family acetyltransferase